MSMCVYVCMFSVSAAALRSEDSWARQQASNLIHESKSAESICDSQWFRRLSCERITL